MVKWGIYYGIASVVVTMLLFLIKKELLFNFGIGLAAGLGLGYYIYRVSPKGGKS